MSKQEIIIGTILGLSLFTFLGWWTLPLAGITGLLYVLGGYQGWSKNWRRIGIPLFLSFTLGCITRSAMPAYVFFTLWGALSLGYGENSPIRHFFEGLTLNDWWVEFWTRLSVAVLIALAFSPLMFIDVTKTVIAMMIIVWGYMAAYLNVD